MPKPLPVVISREDMRAAYLAWAKRQDKPNLYKFSLENFSKFGYLTDKSMYTQARKWCGRMIVGKEITGMRRLRLYEKYETRSGK